MAQHRVLPKYKRIDMTKQDLKNYLIEEAEYSQERVDAMDAWDMIDAYLKYEGLCGWTDTIIEVIQAATGKKIF